MQYELRSIKVPRAMREAPELPKISRTFIARRRALLIIPFYPKSPYGSFGKHVLTPSLVLTTLAAATPTCWEVELWDENLLQGPPPCAPLPEVVGITVHISFASRAYQLANWYRSCGVRVVLGGPHVESCPEEALSHADAISLGNGAATWPRILSDIGSSTLKPRYHGSFSAEFSLEASPQRSLLPRRSYLTTASLIASRGCHNRCNFCYLSTQGLRMPFQSRPARDLAREFAETEEPYGVFLDNNLGSKPEYVRELCRELGPVGKIWSAAVSLDLSDRPEIVREMALAGCTGVFIGFESLEAGNLSDARKKSPDPSDYERRINVFRSAGIEVNGSFVLGFDHDGPGTAERLVRWIEKVRLTCATFHILTPYPGTPLFQKLEAEGRILHRNWDLYDTAHCVFKPKNLRPEELEQAYQWCYQEIFSHASIWKRRPYNVEAWPAYFAMTYLYKRSNRLWPFLIRRRLVHRVWRPLIEVARLRNLRFRRRLLEGEISYSAGIPLSASV